MSDEKISDLFQEVLEENLKTFNSWIHEHEVKENDSYYWCKVGNRFDAEFKRLFGEDADVSYKSWLKDFIEYHNKIIALKKQDYWFEIINSKFENEVYLVMNKVNTMEDDEKAEAIDIDTDGTEGEVLEDTEVL